MRTVLFLIAGLLLMAGSLLLGRLFSSQFADAPRISTWAFVCVWFAVSALNMWAGVAKAGYSFGEEVPVFLLIFLVPAASALLLKWRFL